MYSFFLDFASSSSLLGVLSYYLLSIWNISHIAKCKKFTNKNKMGKVTERS